jgi:hypothetical protein
MRAGLLQFVHNSRVESHVVWCWTTHGLNTDPDDEDALEVSTDCFVPAFDPTAGLANELTASRNRVQALPGQPRPRGVLRHDAMEQKRLPRSLGLAMICFSNSSTEYLTLLDRYIVLHQTCRITAWHVFVLWARQAGSSIYITNFARLLWGR